ncbi:hypothetical protein Pmani_017598 [Petrolisthes manimaculis]|uniref:Nucleolar 27S pre-rRNA processing Urb2/Npa2 C-terminal domain-containing protein n=1 Tax=Petrolisthes manimaculis TaxID=1843537 RepID=A0AAE1U986_9EUCA|nr:hypothetical protein Pmani_017598 [Petrolisthes manimaculis]
MECDIELREYLSGSDPLQSRLKVAEKAFLIQLKLPTVQKEDVVVVWLSQLLTDKAMTLTSEDLLASWKTMQSVLGSRRLNALCSINWLCPIKSSFIEALVDIINSRAEDTVLESALDVCGILLKNPALAPLITHSPAYCFLLCKGVIKWLLEGHTRDQDVVLATTLILEASTHIRSQSDKSVAMLLVLSHLFVPYYRLLAMYKDDERSPIQQLLKEIRDVVYKSLLQRTLVHSYASVLGAYNAEEKFTGMSNDVEKLFVEICGVLESEAVEVAQCMLSEFISEFLTEYKKIILQYPFLGLLCHMLGVNAGNNKLARPIKYGIVVHKLKIRGLNKKRQEALLYSIFLALESASIDWKESFEEDGKEDLSTWLEALCEKLLMSPPNTVQGFKCYEILLHIQPQPVSDLLLSRLFNLHSFSNPGTEDTTQACYSAYDDLMCEVLDTCVKLRNLPKLFSKMIEGLKEMSTKLNNLHILPESLIIYEGELLFPPRFMMDIMKAVGELGHTQMMAVWKTLVLTFTKECYNYNTFSSTGNSMSLRAMSGVAWLVGWVMRASLTLQAACVVGVTESLAEVLTQLAVNGIKPLVSIMLTLPHNNDVCGSVLFLCHTWGEVHTNLLTTDVGYSDYEDLPKVQPPKTGPATDFSYLLPFISADEWVQISARVANFGNKPTQLALIQLVIQKFSHVVRGQSVSHLRDAVACDLASQSPERQTVEACIKYLISSLDTWGTNIAPVITVHLVYILPFIQDVHLPALAKHMVAGIVEGSKPWREYMKSGHFQEARLLHPHILAAICSSLTGSSSRKRRHSQSQEAANTPTKNYCTKLLKKMSKLGPLLQKFGSEYDEESDLWEKLQECGASLTDLTEDKSPNNREEIPTNMSRMVELLEHFPLPYLNKGMQTAVLLVTFGLLVQESQCSKEQDTPKLLNILNLALCCNVKFRFFTKTDVSCLLRWLIQKRLSLPFVNTSQHMYNLTKAIVKTSVVATSGKESTNGHSHNTLVIQRLDHLLNTLISKLVLYNANIKDVKSLAEYITSTPQTDSEVQLFLHPAVFLLAACHMHKSTGWIAAACKWTVKHLSQWIFRHLKKMDFATFDPSTAAAILTAHTIIVLANTSGGKTKLQKTTTKSQVTAEEGKELEKPEDVEMTEATKESEKQRKWQKLLSRSSELAELCLTCGHKELEEFALAFLQTVIKHLDTLQPYLPEHLVASVWKAISQPNHKSTFSTDTTSNSQLSRESSVADSHSWVSQEPLSTKPKHTSSSSNVTSKSRYTLAPLLATAPPEDYKNLLKDLLRQTNRYNDNLPHTLGLWKLVITTMVFKANGDIKCVAMEHLIPILVELLTTPRDPMGDLSPHTLLILNTLKEAVDSSININPQARAQALTPCSTLRIYSLPLDQFSQMFVVLVNMMNSIVVRHSPVVMDRTPSVLAVVAHLTTSLIAQASQEHKLDQQQIKMLVECGSQLERMVRELSLYAVRLNKVVHFTVATIVEALQLTTVYPAVKSLVESVVYILLDLCNEHSLNHLLVALPTATTTLLKHLHNNYVTFHRFKSSKA